MQDNIEGKLSKKFFSIVTGCIAKPAISFNWYSAYCLYRMAVLILINMYYKNIIKFVSDLQQVGGFLRVLRFSSPVKLTATNCQYNWIIVESDFKHHNPNPTIRYYL
jgi:hypothetical protein